jgi:hypothetical protein
MVRPIPYLSLTEQRSMVRTPMLAGQVLSTSAVNPVVQKVIDETRTTVNKVCNESCQKPKER